MNLLKLEQYLLEYTGALRVLVLLGILALALMLAVDARAQDTSPPRGSFAVTKCGEVVVVWVVTQDGRVSRTDPEHKPDDPATYNAFLQWLETGPHDVYVLPCLK